MDSQVDGFTNRRVIELQLQVINRYGSVIIDHAIHPEAKDVLDGCVRRRNKEWPKDRLFFFERSLIADEWDLFGGGMDPFVIIQTDFTGEDLIGRCDGFDVFPGADTN